MIKLSNLSKSYDRNKVIRSLNFESPPAGLIGICGPNGIGKSTLLRVIGGAEAFDQGEIIIDSINMMISPLEYRRQLVWTPEIDQMFSFMSPNEMFEFTRQIRTCLPVNTILEDCAALGFTKFLDTPFEALSLGNKRKMLLMTSLCAQARVYIFDEPFNGLDSESQANLKNILALRAQNSLVLISLHNREILADLDVHWLNLTQGQQETKLEPMND